MKVVILAGGFGTRLSEETDMRPKPMVEIGGRPILWHIMKIYSSYGFNDFVILLGYKGYVIKEYFFNYFLHESNVTVDLANNTMEVHDNDCEPWKVTLLDTGINTMTGGRIKRAKDFVGDAPFLLTYGDGISNINMSDLIKFHQRHGKSITMTAVQPAGRYGALDIKEEGTISQFQEKPRGDGSWINGGFFVCESSVFDRIADDQTIFEQGPLTGLAQDGELMAYRHDGFWECMDTLRDKTNLCNLWDSDAAPWRVWDN